MDHLYSAPARTYVRSVPPPVLAPTFREVLRTYLSLCDSQPSELANALLLAGPPLLLVACTLIEESLIEEATSEAETPTRAFMAGRIGLKELRTVATGLETDFEERRLPLLPLRRLKCSALWNPWWQLPRAMLRPDGVVVTHGAFLIAELKRRGQAASCFHGDQLLQRAVAKATSPTAGLDSAAELVGHNVAALSGLVDDRLDRLARLIAVKALPLLNQAAVHLGALRAYPRLPEKIVSGSGGAHASRAIGMEVMRRGGEAERFDHGGTYGLVVLDEHLDMVELRVSTHYVTPTPAKANRIRAVLQRVNGSQTIVRSAQGDPHFRRLPRRIDRHSRTRSVVFATTMLRGWLQRFQPLLSDGVYLRWQRRVMLALAELPINASLKPHPGNHAPHPLEREVAVRTGKVEDLLQETDIFVFDYPQTTALWSVACSDRPIILFDLGISEIEPEFRRDFHARCKVITVRYDDDNEPILDVAQLHEAIMNAPPAADPSTFRAMLAGD